MPTEVSAADTARAAILDYAEGCASNGDITIEDLICQLTNSMGAAVDVVGDVWIKDAGWLSDDGLVDLVARIADYD